MLKHKQQRIGLSRFEVIVVVILVLAAVGILFVYARRSWDQSNLVVCQAHLKALGTAIDVFHGKRQFLPASCIDKGYATWAVQIAPFLPENSVGELPKWSMPQMYYEQEKDIRTAQVAIYYCPERRSPPQLSTAGDIRDGKHIAGALGDYAACAGNGAKVAPWDTPEANGAIIIGKVLERKDDDILLWEGRTTLTPKSLPRGLQYTIIIGEKHVPLGQWGKVAAGDGSLYNGEYFGNSARIGGPGFAMAQSPADSYNRNFGSYHPNVCNFLFADGSVRPHHKTMSADVLGNLTNRMK